jgi:hypothetical protein
VTAVPRSIADLGTGFHTPSAEMLPNPGSAAPCSLVPVISITAGQSGAGILDNYARIE